MRVYVVIWTHCGVVDGCELYSNYDRAEQRAAEVVYHDVEDDSRVIEFDLPEDICDHNSGGSE